jgi:ABC-type transport system involved in cytochrome bd biosynthesis fused ATPase/permease subunit
VYGAVGSGKSSLLSSILGELELRAGKLSVPRVPIAFVQQTTFILNASVRDVS